MSPSVSARLLATQSDQRLADLARRGHERAFEAIVHRYRRPLLRYCARMGLADGRADDVLQHSLLSAWLALERGVEIRELRPWLYRIVHNAAVNALRAPKHDVLLLRGDGPQAAAVDVGLERTIAARAALAGVAALPRMQRDAILLSAVAGHSHDEVAGALGISGGAVRGLIYRARATLRAAAAAITPQPLLTWACGSGATGPAERVAEVSAPVGAAGVGALLKGAGVAVSAAVLAGGAIVAPLHPHASAVPQAAKGGHHAMAKAGVGLGGVRGSPSQALGATARSGRATPAGTFAPGRGNAVARRGGGGTSTRGPGHTGRQRDGADGGGGGDLERRSATTLGRGERSDAMRTHRGDRSGDPGSAQPTVGVVTGGGRSSTSEEMRPEGDAQQGANGDASARTPDGEQTASPAGDRSRGASVADSVSGGSSDLREGAGTISANGS